MELCFGSGRGNSVDNTPMFWLMLDNACAVFRLFFLHSGSHSNYEAGGGQEAGRGYSKDK